MPSSSSRSRRLTVFLGERAAVPEAPFVEVTSAARWPFVRDFLPAPAAATFWIRDLHLAFPTGQSAGTRLVLTQSTYQLQRWLDWLDEHPQAHVIAEGDADALGREARGKRGPWARVDVTQCGGRTPAVPATSSLHDAFSQPDPRVRLDASRAASDADPRNPALLLAFASACMELQLLDDARETLERAVALDPGWEAAHFELGKLWLRTEDTERAAAAFSEAARLMPSFAAASSNLGAALGELDRPEEALEALRRALEHDPNGHPVLNNIGAVHREQGRLDDAAGAFRRVITLAPAFVFGYYNLGHTLFLQGRFQEARQAYEEGFARDPQKNPRQALRLAVARAADGDPDAAIELIDAIGREVPRDRILEGMMEAESTLDALSAVPGMNPVVVARVRAAVGRYSS